MDGSSKDFFSDLVPLDLGQDPKRLDKAQLAKIDASFNVYQNEVIVQKRTLWNDAAFALIPTLKLNTKESSGGLLLCDLKVCGLGVAYDGDNLLVFPVSILRAVILQEQSIKESIKKIYMSTLFSSRGFLWKNLIDPILREYYGLSKEMSGVLITRVIPSTSTWSILKKEDVLLEINGS